MLRALPKFWFCGARILAFCSFNRKTLLQRCNSAQEINQGISFLRAACAAKWMPATQIAYDHYKQRVSSNEGNSGDVQYSQVPVN
jgi:hypothetical protein